MERLDTSPWNLSLGLGLPLTLAIGCGPVVAIDDGGSETGLDSSDPSNPSDPSDPSLPTGTPGECSDTNPCRYGYQCIDFRCEPSTCVDGGCCYGEFGGCCYEPEGCCYDDGCGYDECTTLVQCGVAEHCYGNHCEPGATLPYCDVAPSFDVQYIAIPDGGISGLAFLDRELPLGDELFMATGSGTFRMGAESPEPTGFLLSILPTTFDVATGDLDADGDDDLLLAGYFEFGMVLGLRNEGDGEFVRRGDEAVLATRIDIADVDGDGIGDRIGEFDLGGPSRQVAVERGVGGLGELGYEAPYVHATPSPTLDVALGDLGGAGAAIAAFDGENTLIWQGGPVDGTADYWFTGIGGVPSGALAIGDFDGDGHGDLVRAVPWQGWTMIDVLHGTDAGLVSTYTQMIPGEHYLAAAVELDGDGQGELVLAGPSGSFTVLRGGAWASDGAFECAQSYGSGIGGAAVEVAIGDYDGDGQDDIAIADSYTVVVLSRQG